MRKAVTGVTAFFSNGRGRGQLLSSQWTVIFFVPEHVIIFLTATKSERVYYNTVTVRVPNLTIFLKQAVF